MDTKKATKRSLLFAVFCCAFAVFTWKTQVSNAQSSCIGQVYGTPGCPIKASIDQTRPELCGDAILHRDEECDLGRFNGLTNCTANCTLLYCGDSIISPFLGEECEPLTEEVYAEDPLTKKMIVEVRFMTLSCGQICRAPNCTSAGICTGGCLLKTVNQCTEEPTVLPVILQDHAAAPPPPVSLISTSSDARGVAIAAQCGNGELEEGEECDDGNFTNTDACPNNCTLPVCGNKIREGLEQCDDGNSSNADNCSNECFTTECGDGLLQDTEECDEGEKNSNSTADACRLGCRLYRCGDGVIDTGEECDGGDACRTNCKRPVCGDGIVDDGEECDDGNAVQDDSCTNLCKIAVCGDGIVQEGEECDAAKNNSDTLKDTCRIDCTNPTCGDAVQDSGEECDDGNDNSLDACTLECKNTFCGDGIVQEGEACDDGNDVNEDECLNACTPASCGDGFTQLEEECDAGDQNSDENPDACRTDCVLPICGDGIVDSGEECDGTEECTEECMKKSIIVLLLQNGNIIAGALSLIALFFFGGIALIFTKKVRANTKKDAAKNVPKEEVIDWDEEDSNDELDIE